MGELRITTETYFIFQLFGFIFVDEYLKYLPF